MGCFSVFFTLCALLGVCARMPGWLVTGIIALIVVGWFVGLCKAQ